MHEWALAESVIKSIENNKIENKEIKVLLGELQDVDGEIFKFAIDELLKQKNKKIKYKIVVDKSLFRCNNCKNEFDMSVVKKKNKIEKENIHFVPEMVKVFVKCPKCNSIDFEIVKGRGVLISYEK